MSSVKVSICIPAYNAERFLAQTIDSVLAQTLSDWELIVVDNHSQDMTLAVAENYADPRISIVSNLGHVDVADSWSRTLGLAQGTYLKLLCADDVLEPTCLAQQVHVLDSQPDVALVACRRDFVNSSGDVILRNRGLIGLTGKHRADEVIRRVVRSGLNPIGEAGGLLFRRNHFESAGAFDARNRFVMDLQMWTRILQHGAFFGQSESFAGFRLSDASISARSRKRGYEHRMFLKSLAAEKDWTFHRVDLWRGMVLTFIAEPKRVLLFWAANHRRLFIRRLPGLLLDSGSIVDDTVTHNLVEVSANSTAL